MAHALNVWGLAQLVSTDDVRSVYSNVTHRNICCCKIMVSSSDNTTCISAEHVLTFVAHNTCLLCVSVAECIAASSLQLG